MEQKLILSKNNNGFKTTSNNQKNWRFFKGIFIQKWRFFKGISMHKWRFFKGIIYFSRNIPRFLILKQLQIIKKIGDFSKEYQCKNGDFSKE